MAPLVKCLLDKDLSLIPSTHIKIRASWRISVVLAQRDQGITGAQGSRRSSERLRLNRRGGRWLGRCSVVEHLPSM